MKSVVHYLASDEFPRIRVGIGKPEENMDLVEYVIGAIPTEEQKILEEGIHDAKCATIEIIKNGIDFSMNKYNGKGKEN